MRYLQYVQLEKIYEAGLTLEEGILLTTINQYVKYSDEGICKMSQQYVADKVLNCSRSKVKRITTHLVNEGWIYLKSGKYENKKKQEANEYTLSPKCNKLFSRSKMSQPSRSKMDQNINKYKSEETDGFTVPPSLHKKYLELKANFNEEYAKETIQRYLHTINNKNKK